MRKVCSMSMTDFGAPRSQVCWLNPLCLAGVRPSWDSCFSLGV
jgi:hypothetical protein